ncbi:MAG: HAD hydrolase family protein [Kofleriaceae bacterium]
MQYRLLALDLDGTLLRHDKRVDERDIAAIKALAASGVTVTIVTGRLHSGSVDAAAACGIVGPIACMEGSHLVDVSTEESLQLHPMSRDVTELLRGTFAAHGLASFVFKPTGIHHDPKGHEFSDYVSTWSPKLTVVDDAHHADAWTEPSLAGVAIGDPEPIAAAFKELQGKPVFAVSFPMYSHPGKHAILARALGPSKGTALRELCQIAGCTVEEAVVVGDWVNDVPMFEVAGRSFVMGNAPEHVRSKASHHLERIAGSGGGIAEAIRKTWG